MNNSKKTSTRSKSASHNGHRDSDTKKKFEAELVWTQYCRARVIVEAASLEEAEEKAADIESEEIDDWNSFEGQIDVLDVAQLEGDESDE